MNTEAKNRKTELGSHFEKLFQKLRINLSTENQNNEQALIVRR